MLKKSAMCDEKSKAALLHLRIVTHAELIGVSRENWTIHNVIHCGILQLSWQYKKNELQNVSEML